jgi:hypothetical protein
MKKLSIFETSVIGFFIGVIVAAYTTFKIGSDGFVGEILNWLSLHPVFTSFHLPDNQTLTGFFIFTVVVFTIYGLIIGLIVKKLNKSKLILIPLALLLIGVFFEQNTGTVAIIPEVVYTPAAVIRAVQQTPKQYFGNEVIGDLNADGKNDVAFIIHRKDDDRGTLYYLTSALDGENGKTGTNLLFLGEKITPQSISITNGIIDVTFTSRNSTTTENFYAQVVNGNLEKVI